MFSSSLTPNQELPKLTNVQSFYAAPDPVYTLSNNVYCEAYSFLDGQVKGAFDRLSDHILSRQHSRGVSR
jgi:hypothetical protein